MKLEDYFSRLPLFGEYNATQKLTIEKFNPYHDELGRFTSGPAGKRISARPKMTRRQLGLKGKVRSIIRYSSEERKEAVEKLALEGSDKLLMPRSENGFAQVMPKDMADKRYGSTVAEIQKSIKKLGVKSVVVTKSFAGKDDEEKAMAVRQMQATAQALEEAKAMGVSNKKLEILFTTRLTQADGLYDGWSGGNERDGKITIDLLSTSRVKAIAKKVQADDAPRVINAPTVAETTYASDYLFIESEEDFIGKYAYSVAIHEIGHHYTYKDAETPNVRRKFSLPTPSKYGRTDKYEMLAESFSAWWLLGGSKGKVGTFYKRWLPFVQVVLNANDNRGIGVPEALLKSMAKTETVLDVLKLSQTSPLIVYLSDGASLPDDIEKFNPYHDELGRFTSGPGNSKKVGPGGLLFHITDKKNRKSIEQNGFKGTAENPLFMAEQPHPFSTEDTDVYVIDTSGVKLFPDTKRLIDRSRKSYFSETPIPLGKFRRLIGEELKVVYETHNSFKWNPDVISKFNPYHDELGRFTFASGGRKVGLNNKRPKITPKKRKILQDAMEYDAIEEEFGIENLLKAGILSQEDYLWCVNTYIHTVGFSGSEQDAMDEIGTDPAKFDVGGESDSLGELGDEGKAVFYKIVVQKQLSNGLKKALSEKEMSDALTSLENLHKRIPNTSQIQFHGEAKDFVGGKDGKTNEQAILPNETLSTKGDSIYDATAEAIIDAWAGSSGSQISLITSAYVEQVLKAEGTYRNTPYEESLSKAVWYFNTGIGERALDKLFRATVKTIYDNTQKVLDSQKTTDVRVYRGFEIEGLTSFSDNKIIVDSITTRPIASWSLSLETASGFGNYLSSVVVPKSQVFSTPMTGMGCFQEKEIVLKGFDLQPAPVVKTSSSELFGNRDAIPFGKKQLDELADKISENPEEYEGG